MSQGELAERLDTTRQAVSYYEKGLRDCSFDVLLEIAEQFGVSTDDLLR
ncbi:MAG: helix-turn-helix domain-containing protein [Lachnospiraceae bacterium]